MCRCHHRRDDDTGTHMTYREPAVGGGARQSGPCTAFLAASHGVAHVVLHVGDHLHEHRRAQYKQGRQQVDGTGARETQGRPHQHRTDRHHEGFRA